MVPNPKFANVNDVLEKLPLKQFWTCFFEEDVSINDIWALYLFSYVYYQKHSSEFTSKMSPANESGKCDVLAAQGRDEFSE